MVQIVDVGGRGWVKWGSLDTPTINLTTFDPVAGWDGGQTFPFDYMGAALPVDGNRFMVLQGEQ